MDTIVLHSSGPVATTVLAYQDRQAPQVVVLTVHHLPPPRVFRIPLKAVYLLLVTNT